MEELLFLSMTKAIEKANEKELEYLIAKREAKQLESAYKAYIAAKNKEEDA